MIARNKDKLIDIANSLSEDNTTFIKVIDKDLSDPKSAQEIFDILEKDGLHIDALVNNAGFGVFGDFVDNDPTEILSEMQINMVTLTHLTKLFLPHMLSQKEGKILNIASTAAFFPGPLMAVYYATKAYVLSFSEALAYELKGTGVTVTTLCPGPTNTGFQKRAHMEKSRLFQGKTMQAKDVAKIGFEGLTQGKTIVIPGIINKLQTQAVRFVPRSIIPRLVKLAQERKTHYPK